MLPSAADLTIWWVVGDGRGKGCLGRPLEGNGVGDVLTFRGLFEKYLYAMVCAFVVGAAKYKGFYN
jgi:hypothetical protein